MNTRTPMLTPAPGQDLPAKTYSRTRIRFVCECGNITETEWKNYASSHIKSCGKCKSNKFLRSSLVGKKFGKLTLSANQETHEKQLSRTRWLWDCDCGRSKVIAAGSVVSGLTKSCGCALREPTGRRYSKPVLVDKQQWMLQHPSLVDDGLPPRWSFGSEMLVTAMCKCGETFKIRFNKLKPTSTCGCRVAISSGQRFGKLVCSASSALGSRVAFNCDCGNTRSLVLSSVLSGKQTTCGQCNLRAPEWWNGRSFGRLTVHGVQSAIFKGSERRVPAVCRCGKSVEVVAASLTRGHSKSCGDCAMTAHNWRTDKPPFALRPNSRDPRKSHEYSLEELTSYFDGFVLTPLEPCKKTTPSRWRCNLCGSEFRPRLQEVLNGTTSSCGCNSTHSAAAAELFDYVRSLDATASREVKIAGKRFDIVVNKTAIEYHGLYHHSRETSAKADADKRDAAIEKGYAVLSVYEDEWHDHKAAVKHLVASKIGKLVRQRLRPSNCTVEYLTPQQAKNFHNAHHYDGFVGARWHVAAVYDGVPVACVSIGTPTRQCADELQIHRMSSDGRYAVMGVWSFLLKRWARDFNINTVLATFSDNRLSDGGVYAKIGMTHVSDIAPSYYWIKGSRRFHKSALRKTAAEKLTKRTEDALRTAHGYRKLWDHGKKKWAMVVGNLLRISQGV